MKPFSRSLPERPDLVRFVLEGHRRVRMVPVAQHAQPPEVGLLLHDLLVRVGAREPLRFLDRDVLAVRLLDLHLDRHAVAIPARHVRRVEARERLALDDDVLQDLVDRVADVDVVVRVRRAVVQHEARPARRRRPDGLVDLLLLPLLDPGRLALREIAAHRKPRVRQIERGLVVELSIRLACVGVAFVKWRSEKASARQRTRRAEIVARRLDVAGDLPRRARRSRRSAPRRAACARTRR